MAFLFSFGFQRCMAMAVLLYGVAVILFSMSNSKLFRWQLNFDFSRGYWDLLCDVRQSNSTNCTERQSGHNWGFFSFFSKAESSESKSRYVHLTPAYYDFDLYNSVQLQSEASFKNDSDYCRGEHELTIVTAYWNIGTFQKGVKRVMRGTSAYMEWIRGFSMLVNPIVFFTDYPAAKQEFERLRNSQNSTLLCSRAFLISRTQLWSWRVLANISAALKAHNYMPSPPCTTSPDYNAAVTSKYPLLELAIALNPYRTQRFAWLDIGVYRNSAKDDPRKLFVLSLPPGLQPHQVAYLQVRQKPSLSAADIFLRHIDWLAGGMVFGFADPMFLLAREFSRSAAAFMRLNLVGADQQVLAAMFIGLDNNRTGVGYPGVQLKLYEASPSASADPWFHLAYLSRKRFAVNSTLLNTTKIV